MLDLSISLYCKAVQQVSGARAPPFSVHQALGSISVPRISLTMVSISGEIPYSSNTLRDLALPGGRIFELLTLSPADCAVVTACWDEGHLHLNHALTLTVCHELR